MIGTQAALSQDSGNTDIEAKQGLRQAWRSQVSLCQDAMRARASARIRDRAASASGPKAGRPWAVAETRYRTMISRTVGGRGSKAVRRVERAAPRPDPPLPEFVAPRQVTNRESQTAFRPQSGSRRGPLVVGSSGAAGAAPGGGVEDLGGSGSGGGAGSL